MGCRGIRRQNTPKNANDRSFQESAISGVLLYRVCFGALLEENTEHPKSQHTRDRRWSIVPRICNFKCLRFRVFFVHLWVVDPSLSISPQRKCADNHHPGTVCIKRGVVCHTFRARSSRPLLFSVYWMLPPSCRVFSQFSLIPANYNKLFRV